MKTRKIEKEKQEENKFEVRTLYKKVFEPVSGAYELLAYNPLPL